MPTPAGEITVVRVFGDVDLSTEHVLRAALDDAGRRRPAHLVVDVAGMGFCSVRGLTLLVDAGSGRAQHLLSGVTPRIDRYLRLLWPAAALPVRHPSAGAAVLAAMAQQREWLARDRPVPPATARPARHRVQAGCDPGRSGDVTDDELTRQARAGDRDAFRVLARRHRTRMYRSALQMLGSPEDPEDTAQDLSGRLRTALAAFRDADPP